jgi:phosphate transport system permease protein
MTGSSETAVRGSVTDASAQASARRARRANRAFGALAKFCGFFILALLAAVAIFLLIRGLPAFFGDSASIKSTIGAFTGGEVDNFWGFVSPLIFGTALTAVLALLLAIPISIGIALFIAFYCPKRFSGLVSSVVDLLAAIPSVIYGLWGGLVLVPSVFGAANAVSKVFGWIPLFAGPASNPPRTVGTVAIVLAVMVIPIITSVSRDLFKQTPVLLQEAALGLGATRWEMIRLAVLPFAKSGVVSAAMLGLGRALGETMAVLMILSPGRGFSFNLFKASQNQTIAANIAAQFPEADDMGVSVLIATGLVLFVITFIVNFAARRIAARKPGQKGKGRLRTLLGRMRGSAKASQTTTADVVSDSDISSADAHPAIDAVATITRSSARARHRLDVAMRVLIYVSLVVAVIPLISVLWTVVSGGIAQFNWYFLTHNMKGVIGGLYPYGGILHAMIGTLEITGGAMLISIPVGIMTSVWLVEYAQGTKPHAVVSFLVDVMSGIPSIVAGLFAYSVFSIFFGPGTVNGFVGSVALSILMLPTVIRTCEEMLLIVPNDLREAAYGLGVTKARTIWRIVLPTALPGIVSGVILAIARVIGETAPLLIAAGVITGTNVNLFSGRMMTLPVYVYDEYSQGLAQCSAQGLALTPPCVPEIRMERAWSAALVLIILVLILTVIGRLITRISSKRLGK